MKDTDLIKNYTGNLYLIKDPKTGRIVNVSTSMTFVGVNAGGQQNTFIGLDCILTNPTIEMKQSK